MDVLQYACIIYKDILQIDTYNILGQQNVQEMSHCRIKSIKGNNLPVSSYSYYSFFGKTMGEIYQQRKYVSMFICMYVLEDILFPDQSRIKIVFFSEQKRS